METTTIAVRVQPKRSLLGNAFVGVTLGTAPLFWVTYWFTSSRGGVELVIVGNVIVVAIALGIVWRQLYVFCAVTPTELVGNGISTPLVRVPLPDIREVHLVPTYVGAAPETVLQLVVQSADGHVLFRMRGNYWNESDLVKLASALPVRVERATEPVNVRDFFRAYPGAAFWFEQHLWVKIAAIALSVGAGIALVATVMQSLGLPVRFL